MWRFGKQAALATTVAAAGLFVAPSAEAASYRIFPTDDAAGLYASPDRTFGVVGDGTLGNDSWRAEVGTIPGGPTYDYYYVGDLVLGNPIATQITIRDIVRMSFDTKRGTAFRANDFTIQIETGDEDLEYFTYYSAIDFATNYSDGASGIDESGLYNPGAWNTYEWNADGDDGDGLEGMLHQSESGASNGGNGLNNAWLTLSETLAADAERTDGYYDWLDQTITGIKISARDDRGPLVSQLDNFTFTYNTGDGDQTVVVDFAATAVPTPAAAGAGLLGLAGMLLRRRREA